MIQYLKYGSCLIFGFILAWNLKCCKTCENSVIRNNLTTHDTIWSHIDTGTHSISYRDTGSYHTVQMQVPQNVDTAQILKRYYQLAIYNRHFKNDSLEATAIDSISQNRIVGTSWLKYKWLVPEKTIDNTIVIKPRNKVFIGIGLTGSASTFGASIQGGLLTKKDNLFTGGYDIINKDVNLSAYIKIHL